MVSYLCRVNRFGIYMLIRSISSNQSRDTASLGIRQSPRGERLTEPTLGPSGRQLAFELLLEEAAEEGVEPFLDRCIVVDACEGFLR